MKATAETAPAVTLSVSEFKHTTQGRQRALWCPHRKTCIINAHKTAPKLHRDTLSHGFSIWTCRSMHVGCLSGDLALSEGDGCHQWCPGGFIQHLSILINSSASAPKLKRLCGVRTEQKLNTGQERRDQISQLAATATITCPGSSFILCSISTRPLFYLHLKQKERVCEWMRRRLPHLRLDWSLHISLIMALTIAFG